MTRFAPDPKSLRAHPVPTWFEDAKFGVFVHWSLSCVPAWAPRAGSLIELIATRLPELQKYSPYAEWYWNCVRIPGVPSRSTTRRSGRTRRTSRSASPSTAC